MIGAFAATLLTPALAAHAHGTLATSDPAASSQISQPVSKAFLTFSAPLNTTPATVTLAIDGGTPRPLTTTAERQDLVALIPTDISGGTRSATPQTWTISYQVVSDDGHPISGELTFTVAATPSTRSSDATTSPPPATPAAATSAPSSPTADPPAARPHDTGIDPHAKVTAERLIGPGLAFGLIAIAALLVVVGPRLARRTTPPDNAAPDDGAPDTTDDDQDMPGPVTGGDQP